MFDFSSPKGFIEIDGKNIEWQIFNPQNSEIDFSTKPLIILLHEGLGCIELWRDFPQNLANLIGYQVFAYSRFGYGQSDPADLPRPLNYMTLEAINILPQLLQKLDRHHYILLGHSDGATIAAEYIGRIQNHKILSAILLAPHFFTEDFQLEEIAKAKEHFETTALIDKLRKYHKNPENMFRGWNEAWLHPDFKDWNVEEVIKNFSIPVLAIQGKQDQYGSFAQIEIIKLLSPMPVDILHLDECKHNPHLEKQGHCLERIKKFLNIRKRPENS